MSQITPPDPDEISRIRRSRNNVLGLLLAGFVILVFFISIAKMG
jgi:hypothetical protein